MPLARRMSNSSVASASSLRSFPATIDSSTKVTKEKVGKIMSRRKTLQQKAAAKDKENGENNVMLSPTPYWKVAKERGGITTPPETRSAKRVKKEAGAKKLDFSAPGCAENKDGSALLIFSPPNQKENAQREKEVIEQKTKARASRVKKARDSGQLLVFSPTMRNPAPLPAEATGEQVSEEADAMDEEKDTSLIIAGNKSTNRDEERENVSVSPTNMEVEVAAHGSEKSQVSLVTAHSDTHNEAIAEELKNLREKIHILVDRKSNSDEAKQHNISLEAHMIRTEKVLHENAKLEIKIEKLETTMKEIETRTSEEKERLVAEAARLDNELAVATKNAETSVLTIEHLKGEMKDQIGQSQRERARLLEQIEELKEELEGSRARLVEYKAMLQASNEDLVQERKSMAKEKEEWKNTNSSFEIEIQELRKSNASKEKTLKTYELKIDTLENSLLPEADAKLKHGILKLEGFEQNEEILRRQIVELEQHVELLKDDLSHIKDEQEEERKHFQELNEKSSDAYQAMKEKLREKDDCIHDLTIQAEKTSTKLASESKKMQDTVEELQCLRNTMDTRTAELERVLEDITTELDESTKEKKVLELKLAVAIEQLQESTTFKEDVLARSDAASTANQILQQQILQLQQALQVSEVECDEAKKRAKTFNERETELYNRLQESDRVRRGLHNRVMQLSGNIRVYIRVRPILPGENSLQPQQSCKKKRKHDEIEHESPFHYPGMGGQESASKSTFGADDPTKNVVEVMEPWKDRGGLTERRKKWKFGFDNVFTPYHSQEDIWEATAPLVQSVVDGYNVTVFAYGQTGSGKTFTMLGESGQEGIIARSVRMLFAAKKSISELTRGESKVEISVELLEVYNEKVRDLLDSNKTEQEASLAIKANEAVGSTVVPTQSELDVASVLEKAQSRRCVKATASNAVSSRSHMLFTIYFKVIAKDGTSRLGKLNVCDLAGSERLGKSNANEDVGGALLRETKHINTSLSVLSNVIEKLQIGDANVPYRESKLTHLLQNSLGGNSKTLAIVCCNPLQSHFHESLCSLRFASKVNKVELKAVANFSA